METVYLFADSQLVTHPTSNPTRRKSTALNTTPNHHLISVTDDVIRDGKEPSLLEFHHLISVTDDVITN